MAAVTSRGTKAPVAWCKLASVRPALVCLLSLTLIACAHAPPRTRVARALVASGTVAIVFGGLASAGCVDVSEAHDGCSGGPGGADLGAGVPLIAVGAGLVVGGLILKSKRTPSFFRPSPGALPPAQPDPFVQPLRSY